MKPRLILVAVCLLVASLLAVRTCHRSGELSRPHSTGQKQASSSNVYLGLRSLVLQGARSNFALPPGSRPTQPFAVVVDRASPDGSSTVIAIADGSASVYLSSGGSSIGGGQSHEAIRNAALQTVKCADEVQPLMHVTTDYPVASQGQVNFYAVTDAGVFTASATEEDLSSRHSPFSKLGDATQAIVAEYSRVQKNN
jgi:hypothetical protein